MAVLVHVAEDLPATLLSVVDFMLFSGTLSPVVAFGAASASGTAEVTFLTVPVESILKINRCSSQKDSLYVTCFTAPRRGPLPMSGSSALNMLIVRQVNMKLMELVLCFLYFSFTFSFTSHFISYYFLSSMSLWLGCARPYSDCDATAAEVAASAFSDFLSDLLPLANLVSFKCSEAMRCRKCNSLCISVSLLGLSA